ncbi:Protein RcsF [Hyphomicrobiales bacterium]|nr:Protein RcsF [Hyphomicrobiales bacterium]CAH1672329.1 Protein RcsF [Hyphomicrobiales bacterium]
MNLPDRYAVYVAPAADSALWRFGSAVLGYDAENGEDVSQLVPAGTNPERFRELTADPRVYGFHATIKAPFRLTPGESEERLREAFDRFAASRRQFTLPRLVPRAIGGRSGQGAFIALVEAQPAPPLAALERATVEAFEPFRANLSPADYARRQPQKLTSQQRSYLDRYGYPYVFEEFRFHMTLTNRVPEGEVDEVLAGLSRLYEEMVPAGPTVIDQLALCSQPPRKPDAEEAPRFRIIARRVFAQP